MRDYKPTIEQLRAGNFTDENISGIVADRSKGTNEEQEEDFIKDGCVELIVEFITSGTRKKQEVALSVLSGTTSVYHNMREMLGSNKEVVKALVALLDPSLGEVCILHTIIMLVNGKVVSKWQLNTFTSFI